MKNELIIQLFEEFITSYDEQEKNRIWEEHSKKFRKFWNEKIASGNEVSLNNNEIDDIVRILDYNAKGKKANAEVVAKTMINPNFWYSIFHDIRNNQELSNTITKILTEENLDGEAKYIDHLYDINKKKNSITGDSAVCINTFLVAYNPTKYLSAISLNHREKIIDYLGLDYDIKASIGSRIVQSNDLIIGYFAELNLSKNARTISRFLYSDDPAFKSLWFNTQKINYWIFQGNPEIFNFKTALKENLLNNFTVTAYKSRIKVGDKIILWLTGKEAGCYALGEVTEPPQIVNSSQDDHLWKVNNENQLKAGIKITHNFIDDPILKAEVMKNEKLKNLKVGNQGSNFSATKMEYETLKNMRTTMDNKKYWLYAPGENANKWEEFYEKDIMAIAWDELGDLKKYKTSKEIEEELLKHHPEKKRSFNDALANYEFANKISIGDIIIVKKGSRLLLGYGVVESDYYYDQKEEFYTAKRKVKWIKKGEWDPEHSLVQKTLTNITKYPTDHPDYENYYERLIATMGGERAVNNNDETYYEELKRFLFQAESTDLKTSEYLKIYKGLKVKVSFGQGNVSKVPWIAFLNDIDHVQKGIYPVYLYYRDKKLLILAYGISETNIPERSWKIENKKTIDQYFSENNLGKPARYGSSFVYKAYDTNKNIEKNRIDNHVNSILSFYKSLKTNIGSEFVNDIFISHITIQKPFLLLAGISGTGKTRFVKEQAKMAQQKFGVNDNYCLVPVRPDWHEPSDLLGYISRINGTHFITTDFLKFMIRALCHSIDRIENNQIVWKDFNEVSPYWLCLDEMNLAPVEQYFADYLSILETRTWDGGYYQSEPIIKCDVLKSLSKSDPGNSGSKDPLGLFYDELFRDINISDEYKNVLKEYFYNNGIPLPPNLIVAGTVNMDETTHGFSRKVIDRALTLDFQEFYPNNFDEFFEKKAEPKMLSFPRFSEAFKLNIQDESQVQKTIAFMKELNSILKNTAFELAYRSLNELLLSVKCFEPSDDAELQAVWDDFLMQKVMPRIEGDTQKLSSAAKHDLPEEFIKEYGKGNLLVDLYVMLQKELHLIWEAGRKELLIDTNEKTNCRSRKKLEWMMKRLKTGYFTDFWV